jgi:hypothetical protein
MPQASAAQTILLGSLSGDTPTGVTTGVSIPIHCANFDELVFTLESVGTTSGGTIVIEEAQRSNYSGTWSQIASTAASTFSGTAQLAIHIAQNRFVFVRARISSDITGGGSVLVFLNRQGT